MTYYSISEFSKLTQTPITTLRYYDKLGILVPELIKDNNYRYYTYEQIQTVEWINLLKQCGLSLHEIHHMFTDELEDYNYIFVNYQKLIASKKKEIECLEYNYKRLIKKQNLKQELIKHKDYYWRVLDKGTFIVQPIDIVEKQTRFNLPCEIYMQLKNNQLVESIPIMPKGYVYKNNKLYYYVELVNDIDLDLVDKDVIVNIEGGNHYCFISKIDCIDDNIIKMLKNLNKTKEDIKHIVLEKILDDPLKEFINLYEIQIMIK